MVDLNLPAGTGVSLFDAAEWAVLSTGLLKTDPPLVVEALAFTVPEYLQPMFEYLTTTGTGDTNTLAEFVAEASGFEFDSFGTMTAWDSAPSAEFAARVSSLLTEFVRATGIEGDVDLAVELAGLRLPVFGSQPRDSKPLKEWGEGAGGALMCIAVLAGTHAPALLVLAGPAGAIITLGTYAILGGAWAVNHVRRRRAEQRETEAVRAAAEAKAAAEAAQAAADAQAAAKAKAAADAKAAALAAMHDTAARKQANLRAHAPRLIIPPK